MNKNIAKLLPEIRALAAQGLNTKQIADNLDVSACSITYQVKKHSICVANGRETVRASTELVEKLLKLYKDGLSRRAISHELNISEGTVRKILDLHKVQVRGVDQARELMNPWSESAFLDFENDEEAAYWYGWLLTDGCISDIGQVTIGLQGQDYKILEQLKEYVGTKGNVRRGNYFHSGIQREVSRCAFSFQRSELSERLTEQGLEPRKSMKEKLPKFDYINGNSAKVFWRACIEGDGYVRKMKAGGGASVELVCSLELATGFREFCETICGVKSGKTIRSPRPHNPDFRIITYSGDCARKIIRVLWSSGTIFLERKRVIVDELIEYWDSISEMKRNGTLPAKPPKIKKMKGSNGTGVPGVRNLAKSYRCCFKFRGKSFYKSFEFSEYGKEIALQKATEWRRQMELEHYGYSLIPEQTNNHCLLSGWLNNQLNT